MIQEETAQAIRQAIQNYIVQRKWWLQLCVVMPDHLHLLGSLNTSNYSIPQIISPWKSYLHKTQKIDWQEGFFEHRIRHQEALAEKARYLQLNPVRAGLIDSPEHWPYLWEAQDFER